MLDSYLVYRDGRVVETGRRVLENGEWVRRPDVRRVNYKTGPSRYKATHSKRTFTCFSTDATAIHRVRCGPRFAAWASYSVGPNARYQPVAWQLSKANYKALVELHRHGEAPDWTSEQVAEMSKHVREMYGDIKREQAERAIVAGREWVRLVIEAYQAGKFRLDDPRLSQDAWLAVQVALLSRRKGAVRCYWYRAWEWNHLQPGALKKGSYVYHSELGCYVTITKAGKKYVDATDKSGIPYSQIPVERLWWVSPEELQRQVLKETGMAEERLSWGWRKRSSGNKPEMRTTGVRRNWRRK